MHGPLNVQQKTYCLTVVRDLVSTTSTN